MDKSSNPVVKKLNKGLNWKFILIVLISVILLIICPVILYQKSIFIFQPELLINITKRIKLFFGIITIEDSWYKRKVMYEIWINDILKQGHDYVYCTKNKIESQYHWTPLKNWSNSTISYNSNIDRELKRITMAEYFLKNTNADFYINPTDDVFVDSSRINELATILGHKYNTNNDLVMLGNCLYHCLRKNIFLQGGSGYIMTRKMAKQFVYHVAKWVSESNDYDDCEINKFLSYVNQTPKDAACPYMAGFGFPVLNHDNFDFNSLPICPEFSEPLCGTGIYKVEEVYILHANFKLMKPSLKTWFNFKRMISDKNHSYGWYSKRKCRSAHLCKIK